MKVLLLSITAGQGHNATARAVGECFALRGAEYGLLDTYKYINHLLGSTVDKGYLLATFNLPALYGMVYKELAKRDRERSPFNPNSVLTRLLSEKIYRYIKREKPDVIICSHVFPAEIVCRLRRQGKIGDIHLVGILTDFSVHPFWEECTDLDYVVTASELLEPYLLKKGYGRSQLLPFGIPIAEKFSRKLPREAACAVFGLNPEKFVLLVMGGSMGHGNMVRVIEQLDRTAGDFQMLVVCGTNTAARKKLENTRLRKTVRVFGFVDNIEVMMDAADCIVTKPGGLTTSEALAKGLPMIIINPIPGQEELNSEFLTNNGLAMQVQRPEQLEEALFQLMYYPERLPLLRRNIEIIGKQNAAQRLCDFCFEKWGQ